MRARSSTYRLPLVPSLWILLGLTAPVWGGQPVAAADTPAWKHHAVGEVVVTEESVKGPDGVSRLRGKAEILIEAPPEEIWKAITDHDHFTEFMPGVEGCKIEKDTGTSRLVHYKVAVAWKEIEYFLRLNYDRETFYVNYHLDKSLPHDIADAQGTWKLEPVDGGEKTWVTYSVFIDSGRFVPGFVERVLSKRQLPGVLENVRKRVLSGHTWTQ